jgi:hypothetical protein
LRDVIRIRIFPCVSICIEIRPGERNAQPEFISVVAHAPVGVDSAAVPAG